MTLDCAKASFVKYIGYGRGSRPQLIFVQDAEYRNYYFNAKNLQLLHKSATSYQVFDVCGSKSLLCVADEKQVNILERETYKPIKTFRFQIYACCFDSCLKQFLLGGRGKHRFFIETDEDI